MKHPLTLAIVLIAASLVGWAACGDSDTPATTPQPTPAAMTTPGSPTAPSASAAGNLFLNPSFEDGEEPWVSLTAEAWGTPFRVSEDAAHSGDRSALLDMKALEDAGAKVFGVVQEAAPPQFPEVISGYYKVGEWTRGTDIQYMQFVVIVFDAANGPTGFPNHQIRYLLAGTSEPPFEISNAKFVFIGTDEPTPDGWVYFERDLRQDFIDQWGVIPEGFSKIRVLFEVRYDSKEAGDTEPSATVYYDDLYMGPAATESSAP